MQVQRQIDRLLAQRAAEWIETLKTADKRDRAAFVQWLRQSKLHMEQYLEMVAIDRELRRLDPAQGEDVETLLARIAPNVVQLEQPAGQRMQALGSSSRRRKLWQVSAALAAAVTLYFAVFQNLNGVRPGNDVATAVGEQRTLTLSDGSVVTLNALSAVEIDFSRATRNIELKSGEAIFKVAHDPSRPFVVHTPTANVRAIGTQFNVDQRLQGTVVSVLEGRVQVTARAQNLQDRQRSEPAVQSLSAGEEAQVRPNGRIEKRVHPDVNKALAWRERRLFFEETPLEDMVREFNRYGRSVQLRIEGIPPNSRRYGGIFDADDPNSLADLLSREPDLIVERRDGEIIIRARP